MRWHDLVMFALCQIDINCVAVQRIIIINELVSIHSIVSLCFVLSFFRLFTSVCRSLSFLFRITGLRRIYSSRKGNLEIDGKKNYIEFVHRMNIFCQWIELSPMQLWNESKIERIINGIISLSLHPSLPPSILNLRKMHEFETK